MTGTSPRVGAALAIALLLACGGGGGDTTPADPTVATFSFPNRYLSGADLATTALPAGRPVRIYAAEGTNLLAALRGEAPLSGQRILSGVTAAGSATALGVTVPPALRGAARALVGLVILDPTDATYGDFDLDGKARTDLTAGLAQGKLLLGYAHEDETYMEPATLLDGGRSYPFVFTSELPNVLPTAGWWDTSTGSPPHPGEDVQSRRTVNGERITVGPAVLVNNQWNPAQALGALSTSVYSKADGTFGWQWSSERANAVVAYPEIICGQTPWQGAGAPGSAPPLRTTTALPVPVGAKEVVASYSIATAATGVYDTSFDLWVTDSADPTSPTSLTHEVMIWLDRKGTLFFPPGTHVGTAEIGGVDYEVLLSPTQHSFTTYTWSMTIFLPEHPVMSGPLQISAFLDWMVAHDILPATGRWLSSVELGTEVVQGNGTVEVSGFSVTVQDP